MLSETILIENHPIFFNDGFTFQILEKKNPVYEVKIKGIPVSFCCKFGIEDIQELIFLIREGNISDSFTEQVFRSSQVRQMLASRACRSALMIGKALNLSEMQKLE